MRGSCHAGAYIQILGQSRPFCPPILYMTCSDPHYSASSLLSQPPLAFGKKCACEAAQKRDTGDLGSAQSARKRDRSVKHGGRENTSRLKGDARSDRCRRAYGGNPRFQRRG
ncbi:hypothetical protein SKAU_G00368300 [Synaphobranchus kaupii]|uniref:Uncharacterized protein n=1 Tax=Synaphobranchus kaupii TaxID=118154 RepID=A0A9Q1EFJ0_SYNKA|nr:hypothetical protein SKAU_G00368300 [Synaphobranchus kaupii]